MKLTRSRIYEIAVVILVISYPVISELIYHRKISPGDAKHFSEFTDKISRDSPVRVFDAEEGTLIQFRGLLPGPFLLAVPSAAPWYYFDKSGTFIGWVGDPGDMKVPLRFERIGNASLISFEEAENLLTAQP